MASCSADGELQIPKSKRPEICPWEDQARTLRRLACQLTNEMNYASVQVMAVAHEIRTRDRAIEEARELARILVDNATLPPGISRSGLRKQYSWLKHAVVSSEKEKLMRS